MLFKKNGEELTPYSMQQLRIDNPNVSFPSILNQDLMDQYGLQEVKEIVVNPKKAVITKESVKEERNKRLASCDWTQLQDAQLEDDQKAAWVQYRQHLRDITTQPEFPNNVVWPEEPR